MYAGYINTDPAELADIVAGLTGLHFPHDRRTDLERGLSSAARELGYSDIQSFIDTILRGSLSRDQIEILASHLTIGETYFLRDKTAFDFLKYNVLPELIRTRRGNGRHLRIWSAGCCTGEEAYSIAVILYEMIPDIINWNVSILATDINRHFLSKAVEGIYTGWSFRTISPDFQKLYFSTAGGGRFRLIPAISSMVKFSFLNLAENVYPSVVNNTNNMDIIFCRNVLMYFTPEQAAGVVRRFFLSLTDNGWLIVSPSETSQVLFHQFEPVNSNGMVFYHKATSSAADMKTHIVPVYSVTSSKSLQIEHLDGSVSGGISENSIKQSEVEISASESSEGITAGESEAVLQDQEQHDILAEASFMFNQGLYEECIKTVMNMTLNGKEAIAAMILAARACANIGRMDEARNWCEKALSLDRLDSGIYLLLATIFLEQGELTLAENALNHALYVDPERALAYFALGNIAKSRGKLKEMRKYFMNALQILSTHDPEDILQDSEGITAGRLAEIINISIRV